MYQVNTPAAHVYGQHCRRDPAVALTPVLHGVARRKLLRRHLIYLRINSRDLLKESTAGMHMHRRHRARRRHLVIPALGRRVARGFPDRKPHPVRRQRPQVPPVRSVRVAASSCAAAPCA